MAEGGRALRVYQVVMILAIGWAVGRLPDMLRATANEENHLRQSLAGQPSDIITLDEERVAAIAASVATRVAADAANETVARLVSAGWGPASAAAVQPQIILRESAPPVVHVVNQQPGWSLPPSAPAAPAALPSTPPPAPAPAATAAPPKAHALATSGYAALQDGDRRRAAGLLAAALAEAPDAPQAAAWAADLRQLRRRWSGEAYLLARGAGDSDPLAAQPVLGAGQAGAALHWTANPLSRHRVGLFGRVVAAAGRNGTLDPDTVEGAAGVRVRPLDTLPLAVDVERRFALGPLARSTWATRISAGDRIPVKLAGAAGQVDVYAETGVVGFGRPDFYAGGQARAGAAVFSTQRLGVDVGAGAWGGWQESGQIATDRLDVGPSMRLQLKPFPFAAQVDYRLRATGSAEPGSGPVVTIAGSF